MKNTNEYDIFVSYRRTASESAALIVEKLRSMGYRVFYDVESMRSGKFNEQLYSVIDQCKDFVLVLPENALDRCVDPEDWVRKETVRALEGEKNILPVILRGFQWPNPMPKGLEELQNYQAVVASTDMFDLAMQRLASYVKSKPYTLIKRKYIRRLLWILSVALFFLVAFLSLRLFALPACKVVADTEASKLGFIDLLLDTKNDLREEWDSFTVEYRKLTTTHDTANFELFMDDFSQDMDLYEKETAKLKEQFHACEIAPTSLQNLLLSSYGILGLELKQSTLLCESMFEDVEDAIEFMRMTVNEDYRSATTISCVSLSIDMLKPAGHSTYYAICELLSRLPDKVLDDYYEASVVYRNLPNGVGLEHSKAEYRRFYEKELYEYKDLLNQMKKLDREQEQEYLELVGKMRDQTF